jgi:hypothetical protein
MSVLPESVPGPMPAITPMPSPTAAESVVQYRVTSRLLEGFAEWWQPPAAVAATAGIILYVVWLYRRDAAVLPRPLAAMLAFLRLAALSAVAAALLDVERIAEHEILLPSRVAVVIDSSASMSLVDRAADEATPAGTDRAGVVSAMLDTGGLLAALGERQELSIWRFDADAEPVATVQSGGTAPPDLQAVVAPRGYETRLGEAILQVLDREPARRLAGIVLLSDGGNNAGVAPLAAAAAAERAGVAIQVLGIGSDTLPANLRVADLVAPARVFPGDGFAVTAYLQAQGMEGQRVEVELREQAPGPAAAETPDAGRLIETRDVRLASDGDLSAVRFEVPGLMTPGSRLLTFAVRPPRADHSGDDDRLSVGIEVVDRVTTVLLMAGGPGREYQFMRNVLDRDPSFEVDVLLGTAAEDISQDARRILSQFPATDEELTEYDAVVAIDVDWLAIGPAAWTRLERWVSEESGGALFMAGGIHMESWLADPRAEPLRGLLPVHFRNSATLGLGGSGGGDRPLTLEFTRAGLDAEFLWLADSRAASAAIWKEFPGVYACYPVDESKPGATVYAEAAPATEAPAEPRLIYLAGHPYGSGCVWYAGSSELWRLRGIDDATYERVVAQILRHVSHGRLTQGARGARLLVDRERHPVGGTVQVRLILADDQQLGSAVGRSLACRVIGPAGEAMALPLTAEPSRPGTLVGSFIASREGGWRIELDPLPGDAEPLTRRIQVQLPDRELARPKLDRPLLEQIASRSGGKVRFPAPGDWTPAASAELAATIPDRSRREFETGVADRSFKQRVNTAILVTGAGCLCLEWILRRFARLA